MQKTPEYVPVYFRIRTDYFHIKYTGIYGIVFRCFSGCVYGWVEAEVPYFFEEFMQNYANDCSK